MNKIFKSIWNHVTRTFTAVSENKKTSKKGTCKSFASLTVGVISAVLIPSDALAYYNEDITSSDIFFNWYRPTF